MARSWRGGHWRDMSARHRLAPPLWFTLKKKRTPLQKRFLCLDLQLQPYPSFFESKISSRRGAQNKRKIETPRVASFFRLSCDETRTRQSAENWKTLPSPPLLERYSALCLVLKRKTTILSALLGRRALFQTDLRNSLTLRHPHVKNNPQMNKLIPVSYTHLTLPTTSRV